VRILRATVEGVDPFALTSAALADAFSPSADSLLLVAAGKAAWPMARAAADRLDDRVRAALVAGPRGEGGLPAAFVHVPGGHPLPDAASVSAGERAVALAEQAAATGDLLLVLLSGGSSAMLALPAADLTLDDKRRTTELLLGSGATIQEINAVRKHLSRLKGGGLGAAAGRVVTLALSDVHDPEDDPATIGSGPTVADPTTFDEAVRVIRSRALAVPEAVAQHLERGAAGDLPETPKPGDARLAGCTFRVIGNRRTAMEAAAVAAKRLGYVVHVVDRATRGEARDAGRVFAELALATRPVAGASCVIASGEPTVTVRGDGHGGRNQEFALGAAAVLARPSELALVASIGTDGIDGPTDAAGAIATSTTLVRAAALGLDLEAALRRNDAYPLLERLDDLVKWGATHTNVGDIHILLTMRS